MMPSNIFTRSSSTKCVFVKVGNHSVRKQDGCPYYGCRWKRVAYNDRPEIGYLVVELGYEGGY